MKNNHPQWQKLDWRGARPLTLRELIMKSNFDSMMKVIIDFDPKMSNQGGAFLRACYYIRDMKVKPHDEDYILAEYDSEYKVPYIGVLEGIHWSDYLGYPVKRDKDLHCNDTVLAAHCLWHLTFYGYTPEEQRANADRENEEIEREQRNDELFLCDDVYTDEEIKSFAINGWARVRDEVLERLFTPEEIVEIKRIRKEKVDEENASHDAAEEEERMRKEQDEALKLELKKKAVRERREKWYREQRRKRNRNKQK